MLCITAEFADYYLFFMLALVSPGTYIASLEGGGRKVVTTAGTRVQITATSTAIGGVIIQALEANTGKIAVGGSDVVAASGTRVGVVLGAGESMTLGVKDLNAVWLDSTVNSEGVSYLPFK